MEGRGKGRKTLCRSIQGLHRSYVPGMRTCVRESSPGFRGEAAGGATVQVQREWSYPVEDSVQVDGGSNMPIKQRKAEEGEPKGPPSNGRKVKLPNGRPTLP